MLLRADAGRAALSLAEKTFTNLWYAFGGTPPGPTDCSGVTEFVWGQLGVPLSRSTYGQFEQYVCDQRNGNPLSKTPNWIGDSLFIPGSDSEDGEPGHVMMYAAPGLVFQAEMTGTLIGLYPFDTDQWQYRCRPALHFPVGPPPGPYPHPEPTPAELQRTGLVMLATPADAHAAQANGWRLWTWDELHGRFIVIPAPPDVPTSAGVYASRNWQHKQ
jgi:NlpC/P60 family